MLYKWNRNRSTSCWWQCLSTRELALGSVPYLDRESMTPGQRKLNIKFSALWCVVEQAFNTLKFRWKSVENDWTKNKHPLKKIVVQNAFWTAFVLKGVTWMMQATAMQMKWKNCSRNWKWHLRNSLKLCAWQLVKHLDSIPSILSCKAYSVIYLRSVLRNIQIWNGPALNSAPIFPQRLFTCTNQESLHFLDISSLSFALFHILLSSCWKLNIKQACCDVVHGAQVLHVAISLIEIEDGNYTGTLTELLTYVRKKLCILQTWTVYFWLIWLFSSQSNFTRSILRSISIPI